MGGRSSRPSGSREPDALKSSTTEPELALRRRGRTPQLAPAILPIVLRVARSDCDIASSCRQENQSDESRSWPSQTRAADLPARQSGAVESAGLEDGVVEYAEYVVLQHG